MRIRTLAWSASYKSNFNQEVLRILATHPPKIAESRARTLLVHYGKAKSKAGAPGKWPAKKKLSVLPHVEVYEGKRNVSRFHASGSPKNGDCKTFKKNRSVSEHAVRLEPILVVPRLGTPDSKRLPLTSCQDISHKFVAANR